MANSLEIVEYTNEFNKLFKNLNYEWLQKYFSVEEKDIIELSAPQKEIIDKGGEIYFVKNENTVIGTAALLKITETTYELGKMAVAEKLRGKGAGTFLLEFIIQKAKEKGICKLILYSNRKLSTAIHLYRKYGFKEVEMDNTHYRRADIKMELNLQQ